MRITQKTRLTDLRSKYDLLIGWGPSFQEFECRYNPGYGVIDYMIDGGSNDRDSEIVCGLPLRNINFLDSITAKSICFIIFINSEDEVYAQIQKYFSDFDSIIGRLVDFGETFRPRSYSESNEDIFILDCLKRWGINDPYYIDIGVCHPVIRNNTYLLYEYGFQNGLLIEPNLDMCNLIHEYRGANKLVNVGASAGNGGILKYYVHPTVTYKGHNTFLYEVAAKKGFADNYVEVPVVNINELLEKYCERCPDVIDIDTEGMDFDLVQALDLNKYRAKIISIEHWETKQTRDYSNMMLQKGYVHYMSLGSNLFYVPKEN